MSDRRRRHVALVLAAALLAVMVPALALAKVGTSPPPKPTPPSAKPSGPPKPGGPAIGFVSPSPAAGAVLTSGDAAFAFTYNRKPKQTKSVTCALVGPTASSGPCTAPVAVAGGSSSSKAYSGLANGDYTITVTVVLSDGKAVSASRQFAVSVVSCTSGLSASVPVQDGARDGQTFYGSPPPDPSSVWWWGLPVPSELAAVVSRGHDIELDASLTGGCADAAMWTYSWSYRLGADTQAGVPGGWTGATAASLTVPKWSLRFSDETHEDYTFTVTATPPAGSSQQPLTASVMLRVGSFLADRPTAGFAPTGFSAPLVPDGYTYYALGQNPFSFSVDSPPDEQDKIGYTWYAEVFGGDEIPPDFGQGTPTAHYTWTSLETFLIKLTVCSANAPSSPTNPCSTTNDFIFSTTLG